MDDLAHQQDAGAEAVADDISTGNAAIEAEQPDPLAFYNKEKPQEDDRPNEAAEDADDADDADDEDGDADDEPEEDIVAPVGLKAEEQAKFAQLPAEAQRVMTEILDRRNLDSQKGVEAALSAQRQAERHAADVEASITRDFAQRSSQLISALQPQPPTPPPAHLAQQNLAEYMVMRAQYDEAFQVYQGEAQAFQQMVGQLGELGARSEQHFTQRDQTWIQEEFNKLRTIPEFADEAQRPEFTRQITDLGKELGFSDDELVNVSAKDIFALNTARKWKAKAEKWDAHQKRRNERPRAIGGKFAAAPVSGRTGEQPVDTEEARLRRLYPTSFK